MPEEVQELLKVLSKSNPVTQISVWTILENVQACAFSVNVTPKQDPGSNDRKCLVVYEAVK